VHYRCFKPSSRCKHLSPFFMRLADILGSTFFKPDDLRPYPGAGRDWFDRVLVQFETFWDSEMPRIGEKRARGWRNSSSASSPQVPESTPLVKHVLDNPFERWLEAERHVEHCRALPGRATDLDDAEEDDPFQVVLFSDLQAFMFPVRTPEVRLQLIYAFVNFLGLPFTPPDIPTSSASLSDSHLQWMLASNSALRSSFWPPRLGVKQLAWQTVGGEPMEQEQKRALQNPFTCPIKSWSQGRSTLFSQSSKWFRDLDSLDVQHLDVNLVR